MAITLSVDQLNSDTQEFYVRTVVDQVHDRIPLIYKLRRMRRVITKGGTKISRPFTYGKNRQTQSYVKGATLNSGTEPKRSTAKFSWKLTQTPIKYDVEDELMNNGPEAIVDTIKAEVSAAQEDMVDTLSENMFGIYNGVAAAPPTGYMESIPAALLYTTFSGTTTVYGQATYGEVTRGAVTDFFHGIVDDGATASSTATSATFGQFDFMVDSVLKHRGNRSSLLAICGSALYRKWKMLVRSKESGIDKNGMLAKAGFASFQIDGVEFVLDDNCPAGMFLLLDLSTWEWRINPLRNFEVTPFEWQGRYNDGIDEYLGRILLTHNLVCWKPQNNYMATQMS